LIKDDVSDYDRRRQQPPLPGHWSLTSSWSRSKE